jgi:CYTH domain-containing protein
MLELEKTFLARHIPAGVIDSPSREIIDNYIPGTSTHPVVRIRKNGNQYEITKKQPIDAADASRQIEQTISLTADEWHELNSLNGKQIRKIRYQFPWKDLIAEFDVFQDELSGLVLVDLEFTNDAQKESCGIPDFCLAEVTQEKFIAGGKLSGKSYSDIEPQLAIFNYSKLSL